MTVQRAMQADRPDQRLRITKATQPFEDGLRTDPHQKGARGGHEHHQDEAAPADQRARGGH
jgi:hypothetical protein